MVQYNLAFVYGTGKGVPKNDTQSFEWCQKAAVQGNAPAQYYLGLMYVNGQGVGKDEAKALESFQKATAQGNPEAKEWVRNYTAGSKPKPSLK